ncbi:uncharacterized protein LOC142327137 isoform X2 [Lycorma delicatula]|uniref:uncharacterized protein LOC142327137 isoform X2 n=1 Tax=Lycorma delicatula TaxID=130591 RepID=UPI003F513C91
MAADQQFCLRWNNHQSTLISVFDTLLASGQLVDCTLAAEGQYLKAHKVVLSACSPYLEVLLSQHYEKHPIVILKDVKFQELKSMMDYMYRGEVNISQDQLGTFLKAAESLQIKGLSDSGGENDSRDVGSTNKRQEAPPPPATRKASVPTSQPRSPAVIPQSSSGLTIEPRRQPHVVDIPPSSPHRSREGSVSPTPRKRRRQRRPSQGDETNQLSSDSHIDTSNSCDLPSQAQSTPVPTIPATMTPVVPSSAPSTISKSIESEQPPLETDQLNRLGTSINSTVTLESGLIKEKLEPTSEILLEPKTEYLEDVNNEDSVEDLTLDDDDDMDASGNMDMARPGPSHVDSNQSFTPWQHIQSGDRSATDEVFMAAQEAVGAHRDSQDIQNRLFPSKWSSLLPNSIVRSYFPGENVCQNCGKSYRYQRGLRQHQRYECGKEPMFKCPYCPKKCSQPVNLRSHIKRCKNLHDLTANTESDALSKKYISERSTKILSFYSQ